MKATNCTRHTFNLGGRTLKYGDLRRYVCNECGGGVVHRVAWNEGKQRSEDRVSCANCGSEDIISESQYMKQIADAAEVLSKPHFRELYGMQPLEMDAHQAIGELFGKDG